MLDTSNAQRASALVRLRHGSSCDLLGCDHERFDIDLPNSLHRKLHDFAAAKGTSVERLVASAAEKLAALMDGAEYLRRAAALGSRADFERVLAKIPDVPPEQHDVLE